MKSISQKKREAERKWNEARKQKIKEIAEHNRRNPGKYKSPVAFAPKWNEKMIGGLSPAEVFENRLLNLPGDTRPKGYKKKTERAFFFLFSACFTPIVTTILYFIFLPFLSTQ